MKKHRMDIRYTDGNIQEVNIKTGNAGVSNQNQTIITPNPVQGTYTQAQTPVFVPTMYEQPGFNYARRQYKSDRWLAFGTLIMIILFIVGSIFYLAEINPTLNIFNLSIIHFDLNKSFFASHPQTVNWLGYLILIWGALTVICAIASPHYLSKRYGTYSKLGYLLAIFTLIYVAFIYYIFIDACIVANSNDFVTALTTYNIHIPYLKSIKILLEVIAGYSLALMIAYLVLSILDIRKMHNQALKQNLIK